MSRTGLLAHLYEATITNHPSTPPHIITSLPELNPHELDALEKRINYWVLRRPKFARQLADLIETKAAAQPDPFLRGRAAFLGGLAAQGLCSPAWVKEKTDQARVFFEAAGRPEWVIATNWLSMSQVWLTENFQLAVEELEKTAEHLRQIGFLRYMSDLQLSLAYGYVLVSQWPNARATFDKLLNTTSPDNQEFITHVLLHKVVINMRAEADPKKSEVILNQIQLQLIDSDADMLKGKLAYREAIVAHVFYTNYAKVLEKTTTAVQFFERTENEVWVAQALQIQAGVEMEQKHFHRAIEYLNQARNIFSKYQLKGPLANNLQEQALIQKNLLNFKKSLSMSHQAVAMYKQLQTNPIIWLHMESSIALCLIGIGDYQKAIQTLENVLAFPELGQYVEGYDYALASIVQVWLILQQPDQAWKYLQLLNELDLENTIFSRFRRYSLQLKLAEFEDYTHIANETLQEINQFLSGKLDQYPYIKGWLHQQLAHYFLNLKQFKTAEHHIAEARKLYQQLELGFEETACWITQAQIAFEAGDVHTAAHYCSRAEEANVYQSSELNWRLLALKGLILLKNGDHRSGLENLKTGLLYISKILEQFWQPELIEHYLKESKPIIESGLSVAAAQNESETALAFMQVARAGHTINRLKLQFSASEMLSDREKEIVAQILSIDEDLIGQNNPFKIRQLNHQKLSLVEDLSQAQNHTALRQVSNYSSFEILQREEDFRTLLDKQFGQNWCGVTYHLGKKDLWIHVLTPDHADIFHHNLDAHHQEALQRLGSAQNSASPLFDSDCALIGSLLLPKEIAKLLHPEINLLLLCHQELHLIPWPALILFENKRLIELSVPCQIPSWQDLELILNRSISRDRGAGNIFSVSDFQDRYPPLPAVVDECQAIKNVVGQDLEITHIHNDEATLDGLKQLDLSDSRFIHIATHAFVDEKSGYLSGLVLHDQKIWHQALLHAVQFPPLVTLTACSALRSVIVAGNVQYGLATTTLAAGANTIISSLWPVPDGRANRLMEEFYQHWLSGLTPAEALTTAQRHHLQNNELFVLSFNAYGSPK
ncbi:MAG: CHAT domain-containing protein [Ardenticatenaceae bacterium]|nr:CHAT domain-containing protein [Ardenticatenaceae bacterium]